MIGRYLALGCLIIFLHAQSSYAKLKILTTTTTLQSLATEIVGNRAEVESITRGPQDPHYVEAKPSYMVKARQADLVIAVGLSLEQGWLPNILRGSRNPSIQHGQPGYLETGKFISPLNKAAEKVDRSHGDLHAEGNPHFLLDPLRAAKVSLVIAQHIGKLDSSYKDFYLANANKLKDKLEKRHQQWLARVQSLNLTGVVTYHRTLNYFLKRYSVPIIEYIEPKPGVPPTAKHIIGLIKKVRQTKTKCILMESFFESTAAKRIQKSVAVSLETVPPEVGAKSNVDSYFQLIETLVRSLEKCAKETPHE